LIDGVEIRATFPDALSIALSGLDAHLLLHYFTSTNPPASLMRSRSPSADTRG
jgi:hypothetical protein